jgi:Domain of unknown function (DUF1996)
MNGRRIALVVIAAVGAALLAVAGSTALAGDGMPGASEHQMRHALQGVNFISSCRFSHRKPDDPIVYPGQPGLSHDHSFVGNTTTSAFSTLASLRAGSTTCERPGDTAAYWMPTLIVGGNPVAPLGATIYYRRKSMDAVHSFPQGLRMIAGDSHSSMPQSLRVTYWNCGAQFLVPPSSSVPTCPDGRGSGLRLHVTFPSCWDGRRLDSADHQSHMTYPAAGRCPSTHPVAVPAISLIYRYPTLGGPDVALSSGGQYSGHADFFNAWNPAALTRLVDSCLNQLRHCGRGL